MDSILVSVRIVQLIEAIVVCLLLYEYYFTRARLCKMRTSHCYLSVVRILVESSIYLRQGGYVFIG